MTTTIYHFNEGGNQAWLTIKAALAKGAKKVCVFCVEKVDEIDYKDVTRLKKFTSERAKILPRRVTGTCAKHQRELTTAIKRARQIAIMPYTAD